MLQMVLPLPQLRSKTDIVDLPMQKPWIVLAPARDPKLLTSAAQKQEMARPSVVSRYTGLFPILTARVLQNRLPAAMATMHDPLHPARIGQWVPQSLKQLHLPRVNR